MDRAIIVLLLINAWYHIDRQLSARRYRLNRFDKLRLGLRNAGFVALNIIGISMMCFL
jgi:hypothetical protein